MANGNKGDNYNLDKLKSMGGDTESDTPKRSTRGDSDSNNESSTNSTNSGGGSSGGVDARNDNAGRNSNPSDTGGTSSKPSDKDTKDGKAGENTDGSKGSKKDDADSEDKGKGEADNDGGSPLDKIKDGGKEGGLDGAKEALGKLADEKGVHGDKSTQKQIEHGLADKAMYATPGLNKVQAARDGLKKFNKGMKDAGLSDGDGALDKVADATDQVVDKGIEGVKKGAAVGAVGGGVAAASMPMMMMLVLSKALAMVKGFFAALLAKVVGILQGLWAGITGFFTGMVGGAVALGQTISAIVLFVPLAIATTVVAVVVDEEPLQDDGYLMCIPEQKVVNVNMSEFIIEGEIEELQWENAGKIFSVLEEAGGKHMNIAALIGSMYHESSLDPTSLETVYDEKFHIGPKKQQIIDTNYDPAQSDAMYEGQPYHIANPSIVTFGIGLSQWTDTMHDGVVAPRGSDLRDYAVANGTEWWFIELQLQYMIDKENGDSRANQLHRVMTEVEYDDLHDATWDITGGTDGDYTNSYIGQVRHAGFDNRLDYATKVYLQMDQLERSAEYGRSILDKANMSAGQANNVRNAYYKDDGCGQMIRDHYSNKAADGTGQVPSDATHDVYYTRENLPDSLKEYYADPEHLGIQWGNSTGWHIASTTADQCTDIAQTYFIKMYRDDDPTGRGRGNGGMVAENWATIYNSTTTSVPSEGAVFSDKTTSDAGHTGIVQHVFANGDILIIEQNSPASGKGANLKYSWNWRVVSQSTYEGKNYKFFKPDGAVPKWHADIES